MSRLPVFILLLLAFSLSFSDAKKCKKPKKQQTAKIVVYPALGSEIVNSGGLYNNYTGICSNCKNAGATLFFPGQSSVANSDNSILHGSLDVFCTNYSNLCIKGKGGWYGMVGGGAIWNVGIYTICNPKGKKCKNYAQLGCNLTSFVGTAGLFKLKGANLNKVKKSKWTCAQQQGPTGTGQAPLISKQNKYIQVKRISCGGCKPIKKPKCKGPTVTPTTGGGGGTVTTTTASSTSTGGGVLTASDRAVVTNAHNNYRQQLANGLSLNLGGTALPKASNMYKMRYDLAIDTIAQAWSNRCVFQHSGASGYGENLYGVSVQIPAAQALQQAVDSWWSELAQYGVAADLNLTQTEFNKGIGHWSQVAWHNSYTLGCGVTWCPNLPMTFVTCNYKPQGNILNTPIYTPGTPCTSDAGCTAAGGGTCEVSSGLCVL